MVRSQDAYPGAGGTPDADSSTEEEDNRCEAHRVGWEDGVDGATRFLTRHGQCRCAVVGLASKDRSSLTVTGATLRGCTYPVVAFQKKPEFGPAVVDAKDVEVLDAKDQSLVQAGSKVTLNGAQLVTKHLDILSILYAEEKRRDF